MNTLARRFLLNQATISFNKKMMFSSTTQQANIFNIKSVDQWNKLVLQNKKPVVVDFFATWCGPCKRLYPLIEKIAKENQDNFDLVTVDIDENPDLAAAHGVQSIPSVKLFVGGAVKDEFLGLPPNDKLKAFFAQVIVKVQ